ncbi:CRISPR-associated helicase Cas3' [Polymorphum gilvum]|uniref:CRISPR-associated helicase Cas3' n=1 Tax=Polymorphum gilvum TaxID=991904 RepID=UPI0013054727|nr:CRISPR-associated helicase Cas3' [Polymorphum gilvum]
MSDNPIFSQSGLPLGKWDEEGNRQPLVEHSRDVAAVFSALARLPGIRKRLTRLAATAEFLDIWIERLAWFVFLHDLGKANWGFQARIESTACAVGHIAPIAGAYDAIVDQLDPVRMASWGDETMLGDWFHAVLSHHGKPWPQNPGPNKTACYKKYWQVRGDYDPIAEVQRLREAADQFHGTAFRQCSPELPFTSPLIHALAGLVMLADWIASSDWRASPDAAHLSTWAQRICCGIGFDPEPWRRTIVPDDFQAAFGFTPRTSQLDFVNAPGSLAILEAETGSGKTEAALWRFVERFRAGAVDGLYFALPSRTAAVQVHGRVERMIQALWPNDSPPCILAVPGYLDDASGGGLPVAADMLDCPEEDTRAPTPWASEHPKRYFTGMIGVGTLDQALLSVLRVKHAHMRSAALMRHMLVIDEVHASDAYMSRLTEILLRDHLAAGGEAALLSATLGGHARARYAAVGRLFNLNDLHLDDLSRSVTVPYPALTVQTSTGSETMALDPSGRSKRVSMAVECLIDDAHRIAGIAFAAAREGAKVLVVRNTVQGAVDVQMALENLAGQGAPELFRVSGDPARHPPVATLHHGRFAREDRRLLDAAVERAVGKARPPGGLVLVGTQTLEQSLDIDADYLITDLCPMDVLLQRLGRLHRHETETDGSLRLRPDAFRDARALVLAPAEALAGLLTTVPRTRRNRHGLGPRKDADGVPRGVYPDLLALEATRRLCLDQPVWTIPEMNRILVERALHPEAHDEILMTMPAEQREAWERHWRDIDGVRFGDTMTARGAALDRRKPFMDLANALLPQEHLATRLGDEGYILKLPEATLGPFGTPISRIVIPAWWLAGIPDPSKISISICFENNNSNLPNAIPYSRLGLQR